MRVVVNVTDQTTSRAAAALAAHREITQVGLLRHRPGPGWEHRMRSVETPDGFDVLVTARPVEGFDLRQVTPSEGGQVEWASPSGLARTLGRDLPGAEPAITVPGRPLRRGRRIPFPAPLGWLRAEQGPDGVWFAPTDRPVAGVVAFVGDRARAVVDDPAYMAAVCLAAGVFCPPGPVWNHPDYEARVVELGLVVSSTTP